VFKLENKVRSSTAPCDRRDKGLVRDWQSYRRRRKKRVDGIFSWHDTPIPIKRCKVLEDARRKRRRDAEMSFLAPPKILTIYGGGRRTSCRAVFTRYPRSGRQVEPTGIPLDGCTWMPSRWNSDRILTRPAVAAALDEGRDPRPLALKSST